MFKTDNIQSPSEREKENSTAVLSQSTYTETPKPPLVKEKTPVLKHVNFQERKKNLSGVTLSVLTLVRCDVLCRHSTQIVFSLHPREEEKVCCSAQSQGLQ
jgi:hypothetical protein